MTSQVKDGGLVYLSGVHMCALKGITAFKAAIGHSDKQSLHYSVLIRSDESNI